MRNGVNKTTPQPHKKLKIKGGIKKWKLKEEKKWKNI
jgi:hypothetical protein